MSDQAKRKPSKPKKPSQRDRGYTNLFRHMNKHLNEVRRKLEISLTTVSKQVASVEGKVNVLLERGGSGQDKELLRLAEQLKGPTDDLKLSVDSNQP